VERHKGLSRWSASMLGIFYFAMEDIYPEIDGTIMRVQRLLQGRNIELNPEAVSPYRSYLALYLWKLLDEGLLLAAP
ncbi:MAG: 3-methyladenine DNA glycosylase, partial [Halothiobacillaceae bacterium]